VRSDQDADDPTPRRATLCGTFATDSFGGMPISDVRRRSLADGDEVPPLMKQQLAFARAASPCPPTPVGERRPPRAKSVTISCLDGEATAALRASPPRARDEPCSRGVARGVVVADVGPNGHRKFVAVVASPRSPGFAALSYPRRFCVAATTVPASGRHRKYSPPLSTSSNGAAPVEFAVLGGECPRTGCR
jgi:hypothetical protein